MRNYENGNIKYFYNIILRESEEIEAFIRAAEASELTLI